MNVEQKYDHDLFVDHSTMIRDDEEEYLIYGPDLLLGCKEWLDILGIDVNTYDYDYDFENELEKIGYFFGYDSTCGWEKCYIGIQVDTIETFQKKQKDKIKKLCLDNNLGYPKFMSVINNYE